MIRFQKILVLLGADRLAERPRAVADALRRSVGGPARICLASVVEEFPRVARWLLRSPEELLGLIERERMQRLESLAGEVAADGIEVAATVLRGRLGTVVPRLVREDRYDLVILDTESAGDRRFGSGEWHVVRDCHCPVYLVRPAREGQESRRILAAVDPVPIPDGSESMPAERDRGDLARQDLNRRILETAADIASREDGELLVVHAWHVPGEALLRGEALVPQAEVDEYVEGMEAASRRGLDALVETLPPASSPAQVHYLKGDPAEVIVRTAHSNQVDLIVMGTVGRAGIHGLLIGNTAEATLRRVDCSVLALKPEGPYTSDLDRLAHQPD